MNESTEEYCRRIGSKEAMEERQRLRREGKLNKPIRCTGGLAAIVARMSGIPSTLGHRWECECQLCRPWLWRGDDKVASDKDAPAAPKKIIIPTEGKKGFKPPKKKWTAQRGRSSN